MVLAYYDDSVGKYQEQRKELEMQNVFEERLTMDKGDEIVWYTEKSLEGDRYKIREHLVDYVPVKADATYCMDETQQQQDQSQTAKPAGKIKIISTPKTPDSTQQVTPFGETTPLTTSEALPKTMVHGKEVVVTQEQQVQKEIVDDSEVTRKIKDTKTMEQEHKLATTERKIFGVKPQEDAVAPRFTKKIQPCRVNEREKARFECEFSAMPVPNVTWFRENFEIKSSDDFKVSL